MAKIRCKKCKGRGYFRQKGFMSVKDIKIPSEYYMFCDSCDKKGYKEVLVFTKEELTDLILELDPHSSHPFDYRTYVMKTLSDWEKQ